MYMVALQTRSAVNVKILIRADHELDFSYDGCAVVGSELIQSYTQVWIENLRRCVGRLDINGWSSPAARLEVLRRPFSHVSSFHVHRRS